MLRIPLGRAPLRKNASEKSWSPDASPSDTRQSPDRRQTDEAVEAQAPHVDDVVGAVEGLFAVRAAHPVARLSVRKFNRDPFRVQERELVEPSIGVDELPQEGVAVERQVRGAGGEQVGLRRRRRRSCQEVDELPGGESSAAFLTYAPVGDQRTTGGRVRQEFDAAPDVDDPHQTLPG
jgi:hypothetical protein